MRRSSLILSLFAVAALAWIGCSADTLDGGLPYTSAAFDAALAQGKPFIVDFPADWCSTCRAQKPIVEALLSEAKRKSVTLFVANFDTEVALKKRLGVTQQSTFVVFKGGKEVGRSTGQTQKEVLAELFDKAL